MYSRTVFIKDNLDRVEGFLYYDWGMVERIRAALNVEAH